MRTLLTLITLLFFTAASAQDTLLLKTGEQIQVQLISLGSFDIKYRLSNESTGPVYIKNRSDVAYLTNHLQLKENTDSIYLHKTKWIDQGDMYQAGREDGKLYYKKVWGVFGGNLAAGICGGRLLPPILCSAIPPRYQNLDFPDAALMQNPSYQMGYLKSVRNKKIAYAWGGWATGLGLDGLITGLVFAFLSGPARH
ncbi:MAG: hypothetical protein JWO06_211 [Bacteroidota bacterium]|nr:hypothetical protein [Bacteroidota bacterium]